MSILPPFAGTPTTPIALATRRGSPIANGQALPPSANAVSTFRRLLARHTAWRLRKPPAGVYNCFGLVWASRRTAIYDEPSITLILREDGLRILAEAECPQLGDLALYSFGTSGGTLHVGIVVQLGSVHPGSVGGTLGDLPMVLSKWDDGSGETIHSARDVPWPDNAYVLTYMTDRP